MRSESSSLIRRPIRKSVVTSCCVPSQRTCAKPPPVSTSTNAKLRGANGAAPISADWIVVSRGGMRRNDVTRRVSPVALPQILTGVPGASFGSESNCSGCSPPSASRSAYVVRLVPVSKSSAW